ncbi:MAG: condensation domain-containing protein [Methylocella sp.]
MVLHRYCGQDEIVIGVPSSGRLQAGIAKLVGNCVNPLAIVGRLHPVLPFRAFLKELGEQVRSALAHQSFPFPVLVERLQPERHGDQWPIYQTSFALQQAQPDVPSHLALLALGEKGEPFCNQRRMWCCKKISRLGHDEARS